MKPITQDESRKIMLDILIDVTSFCDEHNLIYFLGYGTLIGAIRHKGFIPWDDDIDIEMPRPDYEQFLLLYREHGKYSICEPKDKYCFLLWAKVYDDRTIKIENGIDYTICPYYGIDIDIFPLDGQPDANHFDEFRKNTDRRILLYKQIMACYRPYANMSIKSKLYTFLCRLKGGNYLKRKYTVLATAYSYNRSTMVGFNSPMSKYKNRHDKELYESRVKVSFEGREFWAPHGYDGVLRDIYGDYMQLPPVEKQQTHHHNNIFWK